jgi:hypothetical protein
MEKPAFLMPVQRIIGGVEIERDLGRCLLVGIEEKIDEQRLDGGGVGGNPRIAGGFRPAQFQAVQRTLARQGRAGAASGFELAGQHRHHRIMAELVVVVQVLVAERDADGALHHQGLHRVLDVGRVAAVLEAGGQPAGQAKHPVGGPQQQGAGVGRHRPAGKRRHHRTACDGCKCKPLRVTLCRHRGPPLLSDKALLQKNFRRFRAPMHLLRVRYAG